jgi:subtilisin family serine protease
MFFDSAVRSQGHAYVESQETCEDGAGGFTNCLSALEHEVNELVRKEIPVITSANNQNNGNCTTSPARLGHGGRHPTNHHTITVGATAYVTNTNGTYTDVKSANSNFGPCVSIFAPGSSLSVAYKDASGASTFIPFTTGGTSFASAIVSGAVARLLQQYPTLTASQVWTELQNRAAQRTVQPPNFDPSGFNNRLLYIRATE